MALISCAGTESSEQTKVEDNPNLFKAGTPFADSLASTMPDQEELTEEEISQRMQLMQGVIRQVNAVNKKIFERNLKSYYQ